MKAIIIDEDGSFKEAGLTFIRLTDTPNSYAGAGGKIVAVKSSVDGLEFIDAPSGGDGVGGAIYLYYSLKGGL